MPFWINIWMSDNGEFFPKRQSATAVPFILCFDIATDSAVELVVIVYRLGIYCASKYLEKVDFLENEL